MGYSSSKKGYKCWCPTERRLFVSMDVTFRESKPYYGEKTDLSSLFELGKPSMSVYEQEGMDGIDVVQDNEGHQSRATKVITGVIPLRVSNSNVNERQENINVNNMNTKQGNRNIVQVYTRRNKNVGVLPVEQQVEQPQLVEQHVEHSQLLEQQQSSTSGIDIGDSEVEQSTETGGEVDSSIDLPIALRKEARSTAGKPLVKYGFEHDISNYVSYESLSPAYR